MSDSASQPNKSTSGITAKQVVDFLRQNPDFLADNPQLLETLTLPAPDTGNGKVVYFQSYALSNLQEGMKGLKDKFHGLLLSARGNMSVQQQVHQAVLDLLRAPDLETLLERLTVDVATLFNIDAVSLTMETEMAAYYDDAMPLTEKTGMQFAAPGFVNSIIGSDKAVRLIPDTQTENVQSLPDIFAHSSAMVRSAALLRLELPHHGQQLMLALGTRERDIFHPSQGVDLLQFLADVLALQLDTHLRSAELEATH